MISNDQKIPVRVLPGFIGGHGNRAKNQFYNNQAGRKQNPFFRARHDLLTTVLLIPANCP
jgi:hypothetical protein